MNVTLPNYLLFRIREDDDVKVDAVVIVHTLLIYYIHTMTFSVQSALQHSPAFWPLS